MGGLLVQWEIWRPRGQPGASYQRAPAGQLYVRMPFASPLYRRHAGFAFTRPQEAIQLCKLPQCPAHAICLVQPFLGWLHRSLRQAVFNGNLDGLETLLMSEYVVREFDVLVIGAGGAGLRAAIGASAAGVSVGIVTKSLLGKAHTVMAEGG